MSLPDDETERRPGLLADISNAMVGLKKEFYGKGAAGQEELVREFRLKFQEAMADATTAAIERLTGRRVLGYHSQIVFEPEYAFEIFVLDEAPG